MSNPYSSQSASGYNSNPPSDDGSEVASNQVYWATIKTKLADPIKTLADSINSAVSSAFGLIFGQTINSQSGNYTIDSDDQGAFVEFTGVATASLPAAATAGGGFAVCILNNSSALVTIDANSSETINGETSIYLGPGESAVLTTDGSEWMAAISRLFPNRHQTKSGNYTVAVTDIGSLIEVTATATIALLAAATAGVTFRVLIYNSSSALVTIDGASSETINGETTLALYPGAWGLLSCDGSAWTALEAENGVQRKRKTADETVNNSNTLQDDDHLIDFVFEAGAYYAITGLFEFNGGTTPDAKIALVFTNAPQELTVFAGQTSAQKTSGTALGLTFSATDQYFPIHGILKANASAGGSAKLQWAQTTADASDTIFEDGSWLAFEKIKM